MWAKRRTFYPKDAADASGAYPAVRTPRFIQQQKAGEGEGEMQENDFNFIASLGYVLIPEVSREEALSLASWVLGEHAQTDVLAKDDELLARFSQIEYFFVGTDNGQFFLMPLLPPHFTSYVKTLDSAVVPHYREKGVRRLLHRHMAEEPVHAQDHLGTLAASGSADGYVVVSLYHPLPSGLVCIQHPKMIRCVKLWEGNVFLQSALQTTSDASSAWGEKLQSTECASLYLFAADECSEVRLWRIDALQRSHVLLHVFVMSPNLSGVHSSLEVLGREDRSKAVTRRETTLPTHCMTLDGDRRLLVGTEGGVYVWQLATLAWKDTYAAGTSHPLCWDETRRQYGAAEDEATQRRLKMRASRLVNQHVWVRDTPFVQQQMEMNPNTQWKPKYGRTITHGMAVGVVSNVVDFYDAPAPPSEEGIGACLTSSTVTVSFEGGQTNNDVKLPLSCVEPVVYQLQFLRMAGNACFSVATLAPNARILTGASDGRIAVWSWREADDAYVLLLITDQVGEPQRGLGRHFFVLRHPDIFLSCGFDDSLIKEWHLYDAPETFLSCERCFSLMPVDACDKAAAAANGQNRFKEVANMMRAAMRGESDETTARKKEEDRKDGSGSDDEDEEREEGAAPPEEEVAAGVSCGAIFPAFGALFLVGTFDNAIQTYSLTEVQGCTPPTNYIYNGLKTVKLPSYLKMDQCYELRKKEEEGEEAIIKE